MEDHSSAEPSVNLTLAGPQDRPAVPAEMPPGFVPLRLVLVPSGVTLELDVPNMTLGRHSEADLQLPMPDVSRRHCRFTWSGGIWSVTDLASTNGVYVNSVLVQSTDLVQNDLVRIGGFTFAVDLNYPDPPKVITSTVSRMQSIVRAVQSAPQQSSRRLAS
jgi:pSer/pThr/pTyr-binding forkhead associated (FHA) protein